MGRGPQRPALTGVGLGEPARSKILGLTAAAASAGSAIVGNLLSKSSSNGSSELARKLGRVNGAKLVARSKTDGPARGTLPSRFQ